MSNRIDKEREERLQPTRIQYALIELCKLKLVSDIVCSQTLIEFMFKDKIIRFYPYSGWHTGKSIKDGRGLQKLLNQLK